jgi:hypothetical protein
MTNRTPKFEALLKTLASKPMTRKQITNFLIARSGGKLSYAQAYDYYNSNLYGTPTRVGILERFTRQNKDGKYQTIRRVEAPFNPTRYGPTDNTVGELNRRYW